MRSDNACAQNGMIVLEDISAGECLFEIPRRLLLSAENCGIADILSKGKIWSPCFV